jgi:chemotaxis protein methyltransferase CheR
MLKQKQLLPADLFDRFCGCIERSMGLQLSSKNQTDLGKKISTIVKDLGYEDSIDCINTLIEFPLSLDRIDVLASHLTIGETYFFRDSHIFSVLEKHILPELIQRHQQDKSIRIWCAGCSSGEEPYSLAILLYRLIPNIHDWSIEITGTDINPEALKKAEKAQYKKWSFRTMPPEFLRKYFFKVKDDVYELLPEIRRIVHFQKQNLTEPPTLNHIDLISCFNVLIYFSPEQILKTLRSFIETLSEKGWLCVSAVETPFIKDNRLKIVPYKNATFFMKSSLLQSVEERRISKTMITAPFLIKKPRISPKVEIKAESQSKGLLKKPCSDVQESHLYDSCLSLYQEGRYHCIITTLEPVLSPFKAHPLKLHRYLKEIKLLISAYANQGKLVNACQWCESALLADKTDPSLYYTYATILHERHENAKALQVLAQSLYLDSDFIPAYYLGGILHLKQNSLEAASRHLRNALDLLTKLPPEEQISGMEDVNAEKLMMLIQTLYKKIEEQLS